MQDDPRLFSPSAARNRDPILEVLRPQLPASGLVLEVAAGTGEHSAHFATVLPGLVWQPTDPAPEHRASIDAWAAGLPNVRPALDLDACAPSWPIQQADVVLCINLIHIAPWEAARGLVTTAARILSPGGLLALYGPYRRRGRTLTPGNARFDAALRERDPAWGLREVEAVAALADEAGFDAPAIVAMPADNLTLLFRYQGLEARRNRLFGSDGFSSRNEQR